MTIFLDLEFDLRLLLFCDVP